MVTRREIAEAQQALNEAVGNLLAAFADPVAGRTGSARMRLQFAFDEWTRLRASLGGEGAAVARSTSIAAAKSNLMLKQSVRREILEMVVAHWNKYGVGMTSEMIQARLHGKHQTVSARVSELVNLFGLLVDTGAKRETSSGSKAIQWGPTSEAIELVRAHVTGRQPQ